MSRSKITYLPDIRREQQEYDDLMILAERSEGSVEEAGLRIAPRAGPWAVLSAMPEPVYGGDKNAELRANPIP